MLERLAAVRRKFPDVKVTLYRLRKIYHDHKVKKKVIRFTKIRDEGKRHEHEQLVRELSREVRFAKEHGFRIV